MLKYMTRAGFALTTGVRYRYDEQNYLVISVFDSARNKKLSKYYFIVVEREDTTVEQYIVVVDDSRSVYLEISKDIPMFDSLRYNLVCVDEEKTTLFADGELLRNKHNVLC